MKTLKELDEELKEDTNFNIVNRIEKVIEHPQKKVKWVIRLRDAEMMYHKMKSRRESVRDFIAAKIENESDTQLTQMTIYKMVDSHPDMLKYDEDVVEMSDRVNFLTNAFWTMSHLIKNFEVMTKMLDQERM